MRALVSHPVFAQMAPSDITESLLTHVRDDTFYSNDVIFLVENVLFKVPRNVFEESEIFRTMFSLPVPDGGVADGSSDEHPLHLEGIACDDFRPFLRVLVPLSYHTRRITSSKEWVAVLKLSSMWFFDRVRNIAVSKLRPLLNDPVERIALARTYGISAWLVPSLNSLARRELPITEADVERIGWTMH